MKVKNKNKKIVKRFAIKNIITNDDRFYIIIIFMFTLLFSLIFYYNTPFQISPYQDGDSFIFRNCAYFMSKGLVLYKDFIDNKGPLLFFINYFCFIFQKVHMLYFVTLACGITTNIFIFKIARIKLDNIKSFFVVFLANAMFISFAEADLSGITNNMTEFYSMPFFAYTYYKFLSTKKYSKIDLVLLGMCFGITFSLRANLASISAICTLLILIDYIKKKDIKSIVNYILYYALGSLIIILPILLYFIKHDAVSYLFNNYFLFNLHYSKEELIIKGFSDNRLLGTIVSAASVIMNFTSNIFIMTFLCMAILYIVKYKKISDNIIIFTFCYFAAILISLRYYLHYVWILIPISSYPISVMLSGVKVKDIYKLSILVIFMYSMFYYINGIKRMCLIKTREKDFSNEYYEMIETVKANKNGNNKMLPKANMNNDMFIDTETLPAGDYVLQYFNSYMFDEFKQKLVNDLPEFIIIGNNKLNYQYIEDYVKSIANTYYNIILNNGEYTVYKLK